MRNLIVHTKEQASKHRCFEGHTSDPESSSIGALAPHKCIMIAINTALGRLKKVPLKKLSSTVVKNVR